MTTVTANLILLIMAGVWAYLSIITQTMMPVSGNFILLALVLAGPQSVKILVEAKNALSGHPTEN